MKKPNRLKKLLCKLGIHKAGQHHVNLDGQITADCIYSQHRLMIDVTGWGKYS